jgi:hypothetical protein
MPEAHSATPAAAEGGITFHCSSTLNQKTVSKLMCPFSISSFLMQVQKMKEQLLNRLALQQNNFTNTE